MRTFLLVAAAFVLSGCLTTPRPVFDASNSVAAGESAAFLKLVEVWEAELGTAGSPREMIKKGDRLVDLDGLMIVEDRSNSFAQYMAVGLIGRRVAICIVHHTKIEEIAARHGVTVTVDRDSMADPKMPAPLLADGPDPQLYDFVIDAFRDGVLMCQSDSNFARGFH